jgi:hypothetical protein
MERRFAARAASDRDEATLRRLRERLRTMQSLIADRKPEDYLEHDSTFHFGICALSGSTDIPGIQVSLAFQPKKGVDGRDKPSHDEARGVASRALVA